MNDPRSTLPQGAENAPRSRARFLAAFAALCALFAAAWLWLSPRTFYSPDAGAKYLQMRGMGANPFQPCRLFYPAIGQDPEMFYYPARAVAWVYSIYPYRDPDGRVQTNWPPWFPFLSKPFFLLLGPRGLSLLPLLAALLAAALTGSLAARMRPDARLPALAAFALSSPLLFYGVTFWEHTLALSGQLAALLCVIATADPESSPARRLGLRSAAAAALLVSIVLRREALFFAAALAAAAAMENASGWLRPLLRRKIPLLCAALALLALLLALPPWILPDRTGIDLYIAVHHLTLPQTWRHLGSHFFDLFFLYGRDTPLPDVLRWPGQLGLLLCLANAFWPRARRTDVFLAGAALVLVPALFMAITPIRFRALNGIALSAPFLLFSLLPVPAPSVRPPAERIARRAALLFAVLFFLGAWPTHRSHGGLEWGSRYALVLYALLTSLGAVHALRWRSSPEARGRLRTGMAVLLLASLLVGAASVFRGVRELDMTRRDLTRIESALSETTAPIVTDWGWMAASMPDLFMRRELYTLASPDELHGWLDQIGEGGSTFVYASYAPLPEKTLRRERKRLEPISTEEVCGMRLFTYRVVSPPP